MGERLDDTLILFGDTVKALGDGKVGGYLVRFGDAETKDLEGEWFTPETYYGPRDGDGADCLVHHGMPLKDGLEELADHWLQPIATRKDEVGVWAETVLNMANEYEAKIHELVESEKFGWSSATAPHMRRVTEEGEITRWPIIEGSLTPMPAEPRNRAVTLKTYMAEAEGDAETPPPEDAHKGASASVDGAEPKPKPTRQERIMDLKVFLIGDFYHVYATADGERSGDPLFSDATRDACEKYIADSKKPEWLRAVETITASQEKQFTELTKAFAVARAAPEPGGYTTKGTPRTENGKMFSDFIKAVRTVDMAALKAMGSEKVLGDQSGAEGGFTVPPQFLADLIRIDPETEIVWPRGDIIPMASRSVQVPGLDTTGQTAGRTNSLGGVVVQWTETGTCKPETEPEFTQIELVAHEISAYTQVKDALLADSAISIDALLRGLFRDALMYYTDEAFLDGTGAGQPQGVITAPGTWVEPRQVANQISYVDAKNMWMHFLSQARSNSVWVINQMCMEQIMDWTDNAGQLIWQPNAREGIPTNIFGRPVIWTEKTPTLGQQGDILLANFQWYYIGRRQEVSIATSEHFLFTSNRTVYRCSMRLDGQEKLPAPVYLKDGVNQVSPFVVLGAAAT